MNIKVLLMFITFIFSFQCYGAEYQHSQKAEVKKAISTMLTKTVDPFLIVEISESEKYIQFYNDNPGLLLDLPVVALSKEEAELASVYFSKHGVSALDSMAKDPATGKEHILKAWMHTYNPDDIDEVVDVAFGALFEVYGITESTPLSLIKGWQ